MPDKVNRANDHPSDRPEDLGAVTSCHLSSENPLFGSFSGAMTQGVAPERLPKLDVAGSNPVGRSTNPGGYGETRSPLGLAVDHRLRLIG
jgi:hypothetical protein